MRTTTLLALVLVASVAVFLVPPTDAQETVHVCTDLQRDCSWWLVCVGASGTLNANRCVYDPCTNPNVC
jgi:hypothetical protein